MSAQHRVLLCRLMSAAFVMTMLRIGGANPAWAQSTAPGGKPPEELSELKRAYVQFAEQFSMRTGAGYFEEYRLEAPDRAETIASLKLTQPAMKKAAEEFQHIAVMYATSQRLINRVRSTPEETARMQKLFLQGRGDWDEKTKNYLQEALKGYTGQIAAVQMASNLMDEAQQKHASAWKSVAPIAAQFSGKENIGSPVGFVYLSSKELIRQAGVSVVNTSGKYLTNVTIAVETNVSATLRNEAKRHYVFLRSWNDGEEIRIHFALIDAWPRVGPPRPTKRAFVCSIWSDQTTQENVAFDMRTQEPKYVNMAHDAYAFTREGENPPLGPDLLKVGSKWIGTLRTQTANGGDVPSNFALAVTEREGEKFKAKVFGGGHNGFVDGTVENGAIHWRKSAKQIQPRHEPGPPAEGEVNGRSIEVRFDGAFGSSGRRKGTISLQLEP